jgi:hypothetical protein
VPIDYGSDQAAEAVAEIRVTATADTDHKQISVTASFPKDSARRASAQRTYELRLGANHHKTGAEEPNP